MDQGRESRQQQSHRVPHPAAGRRSRRGAEEEEEEEKLRVSVEGRSGRRRRRKEGRESREGGAGELSQKAAGNPPLSIQSEEGKERQHALGGRERSGSGLRSLSLFPSLPLPLSLFFSRRWDLDRKNVRRLKKSQYCQCERVPSSQRRVEPREASGSHH